MPQDMQVPYTALHREIDHLPSITAMPQDIHHSPTHAVAATDLRHGKRLLDRTGHHAIRAQGLHAHGGRVVGCNLQLMRLAHALNLRKRGQLRGWRSMNVSFACSSTNVGANRWTWP